jgi:hypothetical protein
MPGKAAGQRPDNGDEDDGDGAAQHLQLMKRVVAAEILHECVLQAGHGDAEGEDQDSPSFVVLMGCGNSIDCH